jgi:hypothetical protein
MVEALGDDQLVFIAHRDGHLSEVLSLRKESLSMNDDRDVSRVEIAWKKTSFDVKDADLAFGASPNPFTSDLLVRFNQPLKASARMTVRDLTGRTFFETLLLAGTERHTISTNARNWPGGIYLITVENGLTLQRKMVIHK